MDDPEAQVDITCDDMSGAPRYFLLTYASLLLFFILLDKKPECYSNFTIQSIDVSPTSFSFSSPPSSLWKIHFLMSNPSSRCPISFDRDYVSVKLDSLRSALWDISQRKRSDGDQMDIWITLAVEAGVITNVHGLDMKILATHSQYIPKDLQGHFHVKCRNLTLVSPRMLHKEEIKCHSSFIDLNKIIF